MFDIYVTQILDIDVKSYSTTVNRPVSCFNSIVVPCQNKAGLRDGPSILQTHPEGLLEESPDSSGTVCQELLLDVWQQFSSISPMLCQK
ncbi:hypothetical protein DPMN_167101 [Dreissena polymorpha]|uniref:Uncharacterized protein n=1 Tax=Dreissena polymorpha TaxID=45954 RepID=A0A9D4EZ75_DREPO|nr:hypothetical protein DPMN_167101 [Dreissena polymorpha]